MSDSNKKLILAIVEHGWSDEILESAREAGATGATILQGRGSGTSEGSNILGITIEPQKDILLMIVPEAKSDQIMTQIQTVGDLDEPGTGLALQLNIEDIRGLRKE